MSKLLIVGAGGHGKVVADAAMQMKQWKAIAFIDKQYPTIKEVLSLPIIADEIENIDYTSEYSDVIIAVGDNQRRFQLAQDFVAAGFKLVSIIHPRATVSPDAIIDPGSVIFANAVVNPGAYIGESSIINTGAVIEHDCKLEKAVHISPNASLAGNVTVGEFSWIGIGSSVIQHINIGKHCTCGAGSVVIDNVSDNSTVVGVPAKAY